MVERRAKGDPPPKLNGSQVDAYRGALDRLFKDDGAAATPKRATKIVAAPPPPEAPGAPEREKLVATLLGAEGRLAITKAADAFRKKGHPVPEDQEAQLQLLEHRDEAVVRGAIGRLTELFSAQLPRRRALVLSRLRRLEEFADEEPTRAAAKALRATL